VLAGAVRAPEADVRDEHVGGAPHAGRLGPQQRPERARPAQQRAHALHHLRLRLARAGAAAAAGCCAAAGRRPAAACTRARR